MVREQFLKGECPSWSARELRFKCDANSTDLARNLRLRFLSSNFSCFFCALACSCIVLALYEFA